MGVKGERAGHIRDSGFNCAQAVLCAFCEDYDLDTETALKMTSSLGAGCHHGGQCGASLGAALVIGLKTGMYIEGDAGAKANNRAAVSQFLADFAAEFSSITCREILGCDVSTDEGRAEADAKELPAKICRPLIEKTAQMLEDAGY